MTLSAEDRATIRAGLLARLGAAVRAARGIPLHDVPGSPARLRAEALAMVLEGLELQAANASQQFLPDKATGSFLDHHGGLEGAPRRAAVRAVLTVNVTGTPLATPTVSGRKLVAADGVAYESTSSTVALNGIGAGTLTARCTVPGTVGNRVAATVLTWDAAIADLDPTGTVDATTPIVTPGQLAELDADYQTRLLATIGGHPMAGARSEWVDAARAVTGVEEAYIYERIRPGTTTSTLGCATVVALGPAQGDSTTNTRILNADALVRVRGYIEGTGDVDGYVVSGGVQLRPAAAKQGAWDVEAIATSSQNVDLQLTLAPSHPFPFAGSYAIASSTATSITLDAAEGDRTSLDGMPMLLLVGLSKIRGGYQMAVPSSAVFNAGQTTFNFDAGVLLAAPTAPSAMYPGPPNWSAMRLALFALFDSLGPGDTSPARRWPTQDVQGRATLYSTQIQRAIHSASGVLSVSLVSPGADVTPAAKVVVTLGTFLVHA